MKCSLLILAVVFVTACSGTAGPTSAPAATSSASTSTPPATTPPASITTAELDPVGFVKALFGPDAPVAIVQDESAFFVVTDGEAVEQPWDQPVVAAAGDWVASYEFIARIGDLTNPIAFGCPDLFRRDGDVIVADWCLGSGMRLFDVEAREELEAPSFDAPSREDSPAFWFLEAGGTQVFMRIDVEGNLSEALTADGVNVVGDDYAGIANLSNNGEFFVYGDQSSSPSPHFTDRVVMRRTSDGAEVGTWEIEGVVNDLQSDGRWLLISELDEDAALTGDGTIVATTVVDLESGAITRVQSSYEIFLPR